MNKFRLLGLSKIFLFICFIFLLCLFFSRQIAIQNAVRECNSFRLAQDEEPSRLRAQLNVYGITPQFSGNEGLKKWLPVWVVILDGKWHLNSGPLPENGQTAFATQYFHSCIVLVNVFTGNAFSFQANPFQ